MEQISLYIRRNQLKELKKIPGNVSEHIRTAVDEFLQRRFNPSTSQSVVKEEKGGEQNNG